MGGRSGMVVSVVVGLIKKKEKEPPILRGWPSLWLPLCDVKVAGGARVERVGIIVVYKNMCRLAYNTNGMTALLRSG